MNITTETPVAVINHRRFRSGTSREEVLVASCVHGMDPTTRWHSGGNARELVIDEFLRLWAAHGAAGLIVYVSDLVVRDLLREQAAAFPGLIVRDVVSGGKLTDTWNACRDAFEEERMARLPQVPGNQMPLVIATDASRGRGRLTGLGMATSTGMVHAATTRTDTVLAGEFAAVSAALDKYGSRKPVIDILTDSQKVWARLNSRDVLGGYMRSPEEARCAQRLHDLRATGVTVRIHWVRGHNGNLLNEFADRAAVTARRTAQWSLDHEDIVTRLRGELRAELASAPALVPGAESRDYRAAA